MAGLPIINKMLIFFPYYKSIFIYFFLLVKSVTVNLSIKIIYFYHNRVNFWALLHKGSSKSLKPGNLVYHSISKDTNLFVLAKIKFVDLVNFWKILDLSTWWSSEQWPNRIIFVDFRYFFIPFFWRPMQELKQRICVCDLTYECFTTKRPAII
jgi:hypothetical protein